MQRRTGGRGSGRRRGRRAVQGELKFGGRGGPRPGAGRKPKGERAGVSHRQRAALASRYPVHVTLKLKEGLRSLRQKAERKVLLDAFAKGCERDGFRMVQFSVQDDHVHLVAEARDRSALSRGMQGLCIRIARGLNRLWGRTGKVFADRYHDRILRTPREVKNVLRYVLQNGKRHGMGLLQAVDLMSSAPWFDGWREELVVRGMEGLERPVAAARTWLVRVGWRRHGLLAFAEVPGPGVVPPPRKKPPRGSGPSTRTRVRPG